MINYCGTCGKHKACKPTLVDDNYEDYLCTSCRKLLAEGGMSVKVLKER